ncbi:phage baseplate assembly protein V [Comamonas nitrativorans]|uniref:Phage baseplate assembly protein V n=1 Tax=Comamonas nitrativorans TaxID=108437 RepID=A0ABV9H115_9BURK
MPAMTTTPEHSPLELHRLLANMIRTGRVEHVRVGASGNPAACRVRTGDLLTTWVPWFAQAAGGSAQTRHWRTPALGEPCLLLAPGGDLAQAVALPGIYSSDMPQGATDEDVERHDFSATDFWQHRRSAGTLVFDISQAITLNVGSSQLHITPGSTTLTTPQFTVESPQSSFTGNVRIGGGLSVIGAGSSGGTSRIQGNFQIEGASLTHNGINISGTHTHPDAHGGTTGGPQ